MTHNKVEVARDHVQTLIGGSPYKAVVELVWNALDAGGPLVDVTLRANDLSSIDTIEVADQGRGIPPEELPEAFGKIGNSKKARERENPDGRGYHGKEGKGRFKALCLCPRARWETAYADKDGKVWTYSISLSRTDPEFYDDTEAKAAPRKKTGTRVVLEGVDNGHVALLADTVPHRLAEEFASYLMSYPDVKLIWNGRPVEVDAWVDRSLEVDIAPPREGDTPARLRIIEWRFKPEGKRLHLCDERGFSFFDMQAGVQAPGIEYTAYLDTPRARAWNDDNLFGLADLDPEIKALVDAAKGELRNYVRGRLAEQAQDVVREWKEQSIYPFEETESPDPISIAEREVFDIVAVQVNDQHPTFARSDVENKRLTLALIRQGLEANPSNFTKILREVAALPEEDQAAFAELLERTPLSNIVRAGRIVADRLDTIQAFHHIIFDKEWKKRLLERTQLHRLLVHELWILGDEYALATDDDGLRAVLKKHLSIMGREELAPEKDVKLIGGTDGIPDLMLYRRRKVDRDRFEHLVIELKRPSVVLSQKETSQIEGYAFAVAEDEGFDTDKCSWEFVLLGNSYDSFVKQRASSDRLPEGCIHDGNGVRVWVRKWADVFSDARARYEFFREKLEIEASHEQGLERLKDRYPHLMQGRGASKKADKAATAKAAT